MASVKAIVQEGDPVLRQTAAPIGAAEFATPAFRKLVADMKEALDAAEHGVAIAAPQIGVAKRLFIVRYDRMRDEKTESPTGLPEYGVYANPTIVKRSRRKVEVPEGCLSTEGVFGTTNRYERATVEAKDEEGRSFTRGAGGLLAQAFQHEIDHLDGILFIDHAEHLRKYED